MKRSNPYPVDAAMHKWLQVSGSLTKHLRKHGTLEVRVIRQGVHSLWTQERNDLKCVTGYVREVVLTLNGEPMVWARSATPKTAIQGPWKSMVSLGKRPLAELLFNKRTIVRGPLQAQRIKRHGAIESRMRSSWEALHPPSNVGALPRWARSSVFWKRGQALRVMELFAPTVATLDCGKNYNARVLEAGVTLTTAN